jgi:hypothetical protein
MFVFRHPRFEISIVLFRLFSAGKFTRDIAWNTPVPRSAFLVRAFGFIIPHSQFLITIKPLVLVGENGYA